MRNRRVAVIFTFTIFTTTGTAIATTCARVIHHPVTSGTPVEFTIPSADNPMHDGEVSRHALGFLLHTLRMSILLSVYELEAARSWHWAVRSYCEGGGDQGHNGHRGPSLHSL